MNKQDKQKIVEKFIGVFDKPGVYLMDLKGLNVAEMTELRVMLREADVSMQVVKNTLAKRALSEVGIDALNDYLVGPTSVVWSVEDSTTPARILVDFRKKYNKGTFKAGLIDGAFVREDQLEAISKLPTRHELLGTVAATLNAPAGKLARTLNEVTVKFARTVDALREKREQEAA